MYLPKMNHKTKTISEISTISRSYFLTTTSLQPMIMVAVIIIIIIIIIIITNIIIITITITNIITPFPLSL